MGKKRGFLIVLAVLVLFIISIAYAALICDKTAPNCGTQGGVQICNDTFCCGCDDTVCPEDYGGNCSECDDPQCCINDGYKWNVSGEATSKPCNLCCGDDDNENYVTIGVGAPACCYDGNECVDIDSDCQSGTEVCTDDEDNDCDGNITCLDLDCNNEICTGSYTCNINYAYSSNDNETYDRCCYPASDLNDCNSNGINETCGNCSVIYGWVFNYSGGIIEGARIDILPGPYVTHTNGSGYYSQEVINGIYDVAASAFGYEPKVESNVTVAIAERKNVNFTLIPSTTNCEADCTYEGDNICHRECHSYNGCYFTSESITVCDDVYKGNDVSYNETHQIECCIGSPELKPEKRKAKQVIANVENIIRITKIVIYKGKPVKMIIDVFG